MAREGPIAGIAPYIALVEAVEPEVDGTTYQLSDIQVRAILELRLHRLTALGRDEIAGELREPATSIADLLEILGDRAKLYAVMRDEFDEIAASSAPPRAAETAAPAAGIQHEARIARAVMALTATRTGSTNGPPPPTLRP